MPNYEKLYYQLFAAVADAAEDKTPRDFLEMRKVLVQLLLDAEERYLDETEPLSEDEGLR